MFSMANVSEDGEITIGVVKDHSGRERLVVESLCKARTRTRASSSAVIEELSKGHRESVDK